MNWYYWFGKVDHTYHYVVWCSFLLAACRSGDALSIDSLIAACKRADRGDTFPPGPSAAYREPLALAMILMAITYFFPGFWKLWKNGADWGLSDNFQWILYDKWFETGKWLPAVRIDHYPVLFRLGALGAALFEIAFLGLIFFPRGRVAAAVVGLLFHWMNTAFLNIALFGAQMACYVIYLDWRWRLITLGRRLYPREVVVFFDGNCRFCRRAIAVLRNLDWLERVACTNVSDPKASPEPEVNNASAVELKHDIQAVMGNQHWIAFSAFRALAPRIPLFWPFLPLLYCPPLFRAGERIYLRAISRSSNGAPQPPSGVPPPRRLWPITAMGGILLAVMIPAGVQQRFQAWPIACYPLFSKMAGHYFNSVVLEVSDSEGKPRLYDFTGQSGPAIRRWRLLFSKIGSIQDVQLQHPRWQKAWEGLCQMDPSLSTASHVRFAMRKYATDPRLWGEPFVEEKILYEATLSKTGAGTSEPEQRRSPMR